MKIKFENLIPNPCSPGPTRSRVGLLKKVSPDLTLSRIRTILKYINQFMPALQDHRKSLESDYSDLHESGLARVMPHIYEHSPGEPA